eukprot:584057-Heterocapsa_arctica.AAC.1
MKIGFEGLGVGASVVARQRLSVVDQLFVIRAPRTSVVMSMSSLFLQCSRRSVRGGSRPGHLGYLAH